MNIERLAGILREAAKAEIMPRFRHLDEGMVRSKTNAFDLVTEADENAERVITAAINAHSPNTVVVGEEAVSANPALLETNFEDRTVIYVDPVDGTYNFAADLPLFAVMAAVATDESDNAIAAAAILRESFMTRSPCAFGAGNHAPSRRADSSVRPMYADLWLMLTIHSLISNCRYERVSNRDSFRCTAQRVTHSRRYARGRRFL